MRAQRALAALAEDQQRLDDGLMRFGSSPPPPYPASQSHNSTRSQSSDLPSDEQRRREERKWQLIAERNASLPYYQLGAQEKEEEEWLVEADRTGTHPRPGRVDFHKLAYDNVKKRWVEQGIWNEIWTSTASGGVWKHQQPLELESEVESGDEREPQPRIFAACLTPKPPKSDEEKRHIVEQRSLRLREREASREASRPFHQFVYQVSNQRGRIEDLFRNREARAPASTIADINTMAYETVKNFWVKQKIWDERWSILPGMSWKHEEPFEEEEFNAPTQTNLVENCNHAVVEGPLAPIFGSSAPMETSHHQASGTLEISQQGRPPTAESIGLANSINEHSFAVSNSHRPRDGKRISRTARMRIAQPKATHEDGHVQPTSKVSKVPTKKKSGRQQKQLDASTMEFSDHLSVPAEPNPAEATSLTTGAHPRRSDRLNPPKPIVAGTSTLITSADSLQCGLRTRPKREGTSNLHSRRVGKPQGVSKKRGSPRKSARSGTK